MPEVKTATKYAPSLDGLPCFSADVPKFLSGEDTPRNWLESCIETISAREKDVRAFTHLDVDGARKAADASSRRYKDGRPLSPLDGMPVAFKDVFDMAGTNTGHGSPLFADNHTKWDAASVWHMRQGGAVMLGKTVTTEFAFSTPGPTRNAWDLERTPGGSSSGSGAAVGAGMVPVATGTQVRGSVVRPAAFNGAYALKPSQGAINTLGGFPSAPSINHLGIIAGSLSDMWITAYWMSRNVGGDPGHPSLVGEPGLPAARKPTRIARLDTAGWAETPDDVRAIFNDFVDRMASRGVEIVGRGDDPELEALERDLIETRSVIDLILTYEGRWPLMMYAQAAPDLVGERIADRARAGAECSPDDYARALEWADGFRARHMALSAKYDAFVTLNQIAAAPKGIPVGNVVYGEGATLLRAPALNLPLLAHEDMPLGVQLIGYYRRDCDLTALGHWMVDATFRAEN